jgi:hypothetical protein
MLILDYCRLCTIVSTIGILEKNPQIIITGSEQPGAGIYVRAPGDEDHINL